MPLLNYTTKIKPEKTIGEIQAKLAKAGARGILCEYDSSGQPESVTFSMDTPNGMTYFQLPANIPGISKALHEDNSYKDEEHARRVAWRILKDWIEAQIAIIQAGMAESSQVFLPYAKTNNGKTVYEALKDTDIKMIGGK